MGGIVTTFAIFPTGVEFFVDTEPEQVNVYVRTRGNIGNPEQLALTREVENLVVKVEGIKPMPPMPEPNRRRQYHGRSRTSPLTWLARFS
jgi:hypothetical protein